jgi:hypothetical protein
VRPQTLEPSQALPRYRPRAGRLVQALRRDASTIQKNPGGERARPRGRALYREINASFVLPQPSQPSTPRARFQLDDFLVRREAAPWLLQARLDAELHQQHAVDSEDALCTPAASLLRSLRPRRRSSRLRRSRRSTR